ncbi:MAG: PilZ domain-containing protein [Candidatus Omnitrophica bacterium]|nr:PilZ domain-containing protein [Candidatus Omnitrophota bacterium]
MNKEKVIEEKRKFIRLNTSVDVIYSILKQPEEKLTAQTKNISAGGICIIAHEKLDIHTLLVISIYFPGEALPIICEGRVVWTKSFQIGKEAAHYDVGVEFTKIGQEDRKKIDQYVFSYIK